MNLADLNAAILSYLETGGTDVTTYLPQFLRLAEEEIYRRVQFPWLRKSNNSTLMTVGTEYLDVPSDYISTYAIFFGDAAVGSGISGARKALINKDVNYMREVFPDTASTGVPRFYSQFNDEKIIIAPTPDEAYCVEWNYFYKPISLNDIEDETGDDTTWLSENGENALLYGCLLQGYIYLKGDQDVIAMYKEKYENALADLKVIAEGRNRKDSYRLSDQRIPV